jgi:hypothetical protein
LTTTVEAPTVPVLDDGASGYLRRLAQPAGGLDRFGRVIRQTWL